MKDTRPGDPYRCGTRTVVGWFVVEVGRGGTGEGVCLWDKDPVKSSVETPGVDGERVGPRESKGYGEGGKRS